MGTETQTKDGSLGILGDLSVDLHNSSYTLKVDSFTHKVNIGNSLIVGTDLGVTGSVGIGGVSTPSAKLEIDMKNLTTTEGLKISRDGSNSYAYLNIENENATNNTVFKVHENGNVGIGTNNPTDQLHIQGEGDIFLSSDNATWIKMNNTGANYWYFGANSSGYNIFNGTANNNTPRFQIINNGETIFSAGTDNVLTLQRLTVPGGAVVGKKWSFSIDSTDINLINRLDNLTALTVTNNGSVLIGTDVASAGVKLEVSGKTKTTNFQMTSGAGAGKVLTSDASGNATWEAVTVGNYSCTWSSPYYTGIPGPENPGSVVLNAFNHTCDVLQREFLAGFSVTSNSMQFKCCKPQ